MAKPVRRPGIAHGAVVAVVTAFAAVETQFSTGNLEVAVVTAGSYLYRAEVVTVEDDSAKTRQRLHMKFFFTSLTLNKTYASILIKATHVRIRKVVVAQVVERAQMF